MPDHDLAARRTPPEHVNRTTRHGADQYVLACNARRDAGETTFAHVERLERQNRALRSELKWKREHAPTRRGKVARSRSTIVACVIAGIAALSGWMNTPNGRWSRVLAVEAYYIGKRPPDEVWKTRHFLTSDMPQREIDAMVARMREDVAESRK